MSERGEIAWSRVAVIRRHSLPARNANSCAQILDNLSPALREVLGAWLVCVVIAVGCFGGLSAAGVARGAPTTALISVDRLATVASETDRAVYVDRQRRC